MIKTKLFEEKVKALEEKAKALEELCETQRQTIEVLKGRLNSVWNVSAKMARYEIFSHLKSEILECETKIKNEPIQSSEHYRNIQANLRALTALKVALREYENYYTGEQK